MPLTEGSMVVSSRSMAPSEVAPAPAPDGTSVRILVMYIS